MVVLQSSFPELQSLVLSKTEWKEKLCACQARHKSSNRTKYLTHTWKYSAPGKYLLPGDNSEN